MTLLHRSKYISIQFIIATEREHNYHIISFYSSSASRMYQHVSNSHSATAAAAAAATEYHCNFWC